MERRHSPEMALIEEIRGHAPQATKRIHLNGHIADILTDERPGQPTVYHWLIQAEGSSEVLVWGQEASLADAEYQARTYLEGLSDRKSA
jgi:hypothetical protein